MRKRSVEQVRLVKGADVVALAANWLADDYGRQLRSSSEIMVIAPLLSRKYVR